MVRDMSDAHLLSSREYTKVKSESACWVHFKYQLACSCLIRTDLPDTCILAK